jgi:hypothetical protein
MPKKRADKEQEVLGQIFDFIFKEAKKKPEKRKPIKTTGIAGSSMLTDGIAAALEKPGAFLTEQAAKEFNDALDVTLLKISPDELNSHLSVKVGLSTLPAILKDPMGYYQKTIDAAKAARKEGRAAFVRSISREFISSAWARKYTDLDTQQAVRLGLVAQNLSSKEKKAIVEKDRWTMQAALAESAGGRKDSDIASFSHLQERAGILIGRKTFTESKWNALTDLEREKYGKLFATAGIKELKDETYAGSKLRGALIAKYGAVGIDDRLSKYNYLENQLGTELISQYGVSQGLDMLDRYKSVQGENKSLADLGFYRKLEISSLDDRIKSINSRRTGMSPRALQQADDQVNAFERAKILIAAHDLSVDNVSAANKELKKWIKDTETDIKNEKDNGRKNELRKRLSELKGDSRQLATMAFFGKVGEIEGLWGSMKNMAEGGLATMILSGDFFDPDKNDLFRPSQKEKSILDPDNKFFVPLAPGKNAFINSYNEMATNVYYLTPRSMLKTILFNGEGFAYLMYKKQKHLADLAAQHGMSALKDTNFLTKLLERDSQSTIDALLASSTLSNEAKKELAKTLRAYSQNGKLHKFFSTNARLKNKIFNAINKVRVKIRAKVVKFFMKSAWFRKIFSGAAGKLLGQWIAKGSLQSIARALVIAVANALGFATTGGLANVLITVVAMVVTDVIIAAGKLMFGIVVYAFIGIVGIFVVGFGGLNKFQKQTYTYASMAPGETYENPNFTPVGDSGPTGPIDGGIGGPGTIYNGTAQEIFQQVAAEMGITASLELMGPDHPHMAQMAEGWWCQSTSAKIVYCKADKIASAPSAYLSRLFRHELVHQIQGFAPPYFLSEWGADYLSGNGGGYTFYTLNGIQTATQTESYLLSSGVCTKADLEWVALTSSAAVNSPCGHFMQTYMSGYVQ